MIPKIIHLTWFSGDEYPDNIKQCIQTWKEILPDFQIKIWNMEMARGINIPYINEALEARKWAFAGDVVRAYAVWQDGGVYMDTDIFLLKRFDAFLNLPIVFFNEVNEKNWKYDNPIGAVDDQGRCTMPNVYICGRQIQAAFFMAEKGCPVLNEIVDHYRNMHFKVEEKALNYIISPSIYAKVLEKYGYLYKDSEQHLGEISVFPSIYIVNTKYDVAANTIAIHLGAQSWSNRSCWKKIKHYLKTSYIYHIIKK